MVDFQLPNFNCSASIVEDILQQPANVYGRLRNRKRKYGP